MRTQNTPALPKAHRDSVIREVVNSMMLRLEVNEENPETLQLVGIRKVLDRILWDLEKSLSYYEVRRKQYSKTF